MDGEQVRDPEVAMEAARQGSRTKAWAEGTDEPGTTGVVGHAWHRGGAAGAAAGSAGYGPGCGCLHIHG